MLPAAVRDDLLHGFKLARHGPIISHHQFADDTLILCEANVDQIKNVKAIMLCYEAVFSLKVNFHKSELLGMMVDEQTLNISANILGCKSWFVSIWLSWAASVFWENSQGCLEPGD